MEANEMLALLVGVAAGAWGAHLAGGQPWKGGAVAASGFIAAIVVALIVSDYTFPIGVAAASVVAFLVSGAMRMRGQHTFTALSASWAAYFLASWASSIVLA